MVMVGHLVYPAIDPESRRASRGCISLLREDLGFGGVIVTDDLAMAGASGGGTPERAAVRAVEAGADLLIVSSPPQQQADAYDAVVAAVESGRIPESRIRDSVGRLLRVKKTYGFARADAAGRMRPEIGVHRPRALGAPGIRAFWNRKEEMAWPK
jgi:beta-N-acetylhexosaminidase